MTGRPTMKVFAMLAAVFAAGCATTETVRVEGSVESSYRPPAAPEHARVVLVSGTTAAESPEPAESAKPIQTWQGPSYDDAVRGVLANAAHGSHPLYSLLGADTGAYLEDWVAAYYGNITTRRKVAIFPSVDQDGNLGLLLALNW